MAQQKKYAPMNTPRGVAVFPSLTVADTKFKEEGEYSVKLAFDPDAAGVQEMIAELEKRRDEMFQDELANADTPKKRKELEKYELAPVFTEEVDKEGDETGRILINFKMKASGISKKTKKRWEQKPTIVDAKGVKMLNPPDIYGGSVLRIGFETTGGPVPSSKKFYVSCRLAMVKVLELVTRGGYSASAFGMDEDEDGYEAGEDELSSAAKAASKPADESGEDAGSEGGDF